MSPSAAAQASPQIRSLLQQALDHLNRNELTQCEAALNRVLAEDPDEADALQLLGIVRRTQGFLPEAEEYYRRSLAIRPEQPHVHNNLGNLYRAMNRFEDAVAAYDQAIRYKPNFAEAHLNKGLALHALLRNEEAEKAYRQALRIQPNYLFAMQSLGAVLNDLKRPRDAERIFRQALALDSKNPRQVAALEHNLGVSLKMQRRYDEALALFDSAQSRVPDMPAVDFNRAATLQQMGRYDEAIAAYRRALMADPVNPRIHDDLNQLLYRLKRDDDFLKSYDEAEAVYPGAPVLSLGRADFLLRTQRYEEARNAYGRVAEQDPDIVYAWDGLALAETYLHNFGAAIAAHESSLKLNPHNPAAWCNYAMTFIAAGEPVRAIKACEEALKRDPYHQNALALLGTAWRMAGDSRDEALNDYENFVQVFEIEPPAGYADIETFNRDLNAYLDRLHRDKREMLDQTLRGGTQTLDDVFGAGHAPIEALRAEIDKVIGAYIARMKEKADHPLLGRKGKSFGYSGSWSSRLHDCGYHTNHVHPKGWISSAYYVALPETVSDAQGKQGWIKFGEPGIETPPMKDAIRRTIQPKIGRLVLFPSYMWHGTVPFHSQNSRTTIAFDVVPR